MPEYVSPIEQVIAGVMPPDQEGTYHLFPFEVPPGTARLDVRYEYSAMIGADPLASGGNCVDIGIFDSRGAAFLDAGFRGWSGSARQEFFITPAEATPGYLAGPLQPGTWRIFLGFYKVAADGCDFRVVIRCTPGDAPGADNWPPLLTLDGPAGALPARPNGWYRGELHCHTFHSDGDSTPLAVIEAARALGLDFLAITDHNTISHLADLAALNHAGIALLPGCEITTFRGHWNVWGLNEWVDFRGLDPDAMERTMHWAAGRGGLVSCNHPKPFGPPWENTGVEAYHCVEVWNGPWPVFNAAALAFWEEQLRRGRRVTAVGGSDMHRLAPPAPADLARLGQPTTWVYCPGQPRPADLLAALRAGHAFISAMPAGPQLRLWADAGGHGNYAAMMGDSVPRPSSGQLPVRVEVIGGRGAALELWLAGGRAQVIAIDGDAVVINCDVGIGDSPYVRAQLIAGAPAHQVQALSNPIYVQ